MHCLEILHLVKIIEMVQCPFLYRIHLSPVKLHREQNESILITIPCLQCTIIRTTELAAARERYNEVHKQAIDLKAVYSPAVLLERLHG